MITYKTKIGNAMIEYQSANVKDIHKFAAVYSALPDKCDLCGKPNIHLNHRQAKAGGDYLLVRCKDCGAEMLIHQKKDGGGYYVKAGEKMEKYQMNDQGEQPRQQTAQSPRKEEVPF